jgi:CRP-like cAMP-binding protein
VRKRAIPAEAARAALAEALADPASRAGAFAIIAHVGAELDPTAFAAFATALEAGDADAIGALAGLDADGAALLVGQLAALTPVARAIAARALAGAPAGVPLVAALLADPDPEVAYAALRTSLALAAGGATLPAQPIARAFEVAQAALVAHLDARDGAAASEAFSACARHELDLAIRRCVARVLWAAAVEVAAAGRDPATLAATARHLIGEREADRRRALDVVQELHAGRGEILAVLERWLRPAVARDSAAADLAAHDPWLARLVAGELAELEPALALLRKPALLATIAGPALADLAARARRDRVTGELFRAGAAGDTMLVVARGALTSQRPNAPARRVGIGEVVGELAVLTRAPRVATVTAVEPDTEVLVIDRATFASATRRAPELVLGLSATLAGWIAPNRPDLL